MAKVFLVGLPGSGKSTLGRLLAQRLGMAFVDLDDVIEKKAGRSINEIFQGEGEKGFRGRETAALRELGEDKNEVIATGGGIVLREENRALLQNMGLVVFVDRPVGNICEDLQTSHRPLLQEGRRALEELAEARREIYLACADYALENDGSVKEALTRLEAACAPLVGGAFAVIGDPIAHSLSPAIHNAAFAALGLPGDYGFIELPRRALPAFMAGLPKGRLRGFNVTMPHKRDVIPYLDEVERGAALCAAVNAVVRRGGRLYGYNTDMEGFKLSLNRQGYAFGGSRVTMLGAGGAARALALKAGLEKAQHLHIAARDVEKARGLAELALESSGVPVSWSGFAPEDLEEAARDSDILINGTPLGMIGNDRDFANLDFLHSLPYSALVCDLIYLPARTTLLTEAEKIGLETMNGLGMLIYQALLADELFLERKLDKDALYETVSELLRRRL